ncbi:MAG TPA: hypothetical protein VK935_10510 [Actinomycetospora sp.]|nr:hypothetical protein [Actinomycetospora sp.]
MAPTVGSRVVVGAVCGLAWAGALRVVVVEAGGTDTGWVALTALLLTGAVIGGLLGRASGHRARARRPGWTLGGLAVLAVPAWLAVQSRTGPALDTPRGVWLAVLAVGLVAVLCLAGTLPFRVGAVASAGQLVAVGVLVGVTWAAGLRGFMAMVAGATSTVSWLGTFGFLLPPAALVGGLLGRAEHRRRVAGEPRRRVLAPLVFALDPSALILVLPAMAGGWVLAGRGSRRGRWFAGTAAFLPVPVYVLAVVLLDDVRTLATPAGVANALLLVSCAAVLALACAAPQRPPTGGGPPAEIPAPRSPDRAHRRLGVGVRR